MSEKSIFEKILDKEIPADIVFENENVLAFKDIAPQAETHLLFIHKKKTKQVNEMGSEQITHLFTAIREYTQKSGIEKNGFRVVTNSGKAAGQTVFYTHFHVLAGETLGKFGK